ncbi:MAG: 2-oxoacid:acceptor oxidoreductase family protein [Candidatus Aenigmatarchaeota archaeon]
MFEIRFHGRGGQGGKMAAHILAETAFLSGYQTQDFAMYGAERRGAPVVSFTRYDKKPILERGYIFEPDVVIVLDETLNFGIMSKGLKKFMIINSHRKSIFFKNNFKIKKKIYCIPATDIALKIIGIQIANTTILGGIIKLLKLPFKNLEKAIKIQLTEAGHPEAVDKNIQAAREAYKMIK